jgi:hypothetical protein
VQKKINLSQDELKSLEEKGFVFNKWWPLFPQSLFNGECFIPINQPTNAMSWLTTRNVKVVLTHCNLWCQKNITISGRLINFLYQLSTHHWRFLLLDMDKYINFDLVKFQTRGNMKLIS